MGTKVSIGKWFAGFICALAMFACSSDDGDSGKLLTSVDGKMMAFPSRMEPWTFFDNENEFGRPCVGYKEDYGFQFTYSEQNGIRTLEYYTPEMDFNPSKCYRPLPGYHTQIDTDNSKYIKGSFSGDFQNPEGNVKYIEVLFTVYKTKLR